MNDEVRSLLKQSSKQVKTLKEKKDTKVAKEIEALNNVLEKAKNNKAKFYGFMLKKAVLEYTEDPISILNHFSFKRNTNYTVAYKMLDGKRISGLPGSKIARLYNYGISEEKERIYWFDPGNNKPIPVILDGIARCFIRENEVKVTFDNLTIKELSELAQENSLEGPYVDYGLVSLLQVAYNEVRNKAVEMNAYLAKLIKNAQIIYCDTYRKLLREYKRNYFDSELHVPIKTSDNIPRELSYNAARLFNTASLDDEIILCSHIDENGNEVLIPIQQSVLRAMFIDDNRFGIKDVSIGNGFRSGVTFDTNRFEKSIINLGEEEPTL